MKPFAQTKNWVALPLELNNPVHVLDTFNGELIAGGWFTRAGQLKVNNIASWNGTRWNNMNKGVRGRSSIVKCVLVKDNELYVGGLFDSAGTVAARNIAVWDGVKWSAVGKGVNGEVASMTVFNDEIHIGFYDSAGGANGDDVARWDGTNWIPLGAKIRNSIRDICVYKNELYVVGFFDYAGNIPCRNIARWDGTAWDSLINVLNDNSSLIVWNDMLLIGSAKEHYIPLNDTDQVTQWDGTSLSKFSSHDIINIKDFFIFNGELYCAGNGVHKWNPSLKQMEEIGSGLKQTVLSLAEYKGELYCGGVFNTDEKSTINSIGRLATVNSIKPDLNRGNVQIFPNPVNNDLRVTGIKIKEISIYNPAGQCIYQQKLYLSESQVNISSLASGIYFVEVVHENEEVFRSKLIKNYD